MYKNSNIFNLSSLIYHEPVFADEICYPFFFFLFVAFLNEITLPSSMILRKNAIISVISVNYTKYII